jgi:hypothetical protein
MRNVDSYSFPTLIRLLAAIAPGVMITPISSLLDNAGHLSPEPLIKRWFHGTVPRLSREIIFAIGINQLTDYIDERVSFISNNLFRGAVSSVIAGMLAGYFSQVPHNLASLKVINPLKPYSQLFREYVSAAEVRIPADVKSPAMRNALAHFVALCFPTGSSIRALSIAGSFLILNGVTNGIQKLIPSLKPYANSGTTAADAKNFSRLHQEHMARLKRERMSGSPVAGAW